MSWKTSVSDEAAKTTISPETGAAALAWRRGGGGRRGWAVVGAAAGLVRRLARGGRGRRGRGGVTAGLGAVVGAAAGAVVGGGAGAAVGAAAGAAHADTNSSIRTAENKRCAAVIAGTPWSSGLG